MIVGVVCQRLGILNKEFSTKLNGLVFNLFLPISLLLSSYRSTLEGKALIGLTLFAWFSITIILVLSWADYTRRGIGRLQKSVMIQSAYRSNFALFGSTLAAGILDGGGTGLTEFLIAVAIPYINVLSIFVLQYHGEEGMDAHTFVKSVIKNPLMHGLFIGYVLNFSGLALPAGVEAPLQNLASIATPLALVALGAQFSLDATRHYRPLLIRAVSTRLVIVPLCALTAAALLGFRGEAMVAFLALFGSPTAVASYAMAVAMKQDGDLAGQIVIYTSIFCSFTLFLFIFALRTLSLI